MLYLREAIDFFLSLSPPCSQSVSDSHKLVVNSPQFPAPDSPGGLFCKGSIDFGFAKIRPLFLHPSPSLCLSSMQSEGNILYAGKSLEADSRSHGGSGSGLRVGVFTGATNKNWAQLRDSVSRDSSSQPP